MVATRTNQSLDPFPDGWYVIGQSDDIRVGKLAEKTWMGREIVLWRDTGGAVCVADAYCPHLGSHLGPSAGGLIRDGNLVCPFHGFEYDATGRCVAAPGAAPPRSARLARYETEEINGFVFAYCGRESDAPTWRIPEQPDHPGYKRALNRVRLRTHPQTTSENSVDRAHLGHLHGYSEVTQTAPTEVDGPLLRSAYAFTRHMLTPGLRRFTISVGISIEVWGLGVSIVAIRGSRGLRLRQWILATPVDGEMTEMWLVMDVERMPQLPWLPGRLVDLGRGLAGRVFVNELKREVEKDGEIWARQRYRPEPVLSALDRDMLQFRRYCEQFYSSAADVIARSAKGG